jgi:hypothetical protein
VQGRSNPVRLGRDDAALSRTRPSSASTTVTLAARAAGEGLERGTALSSPLAALRGAIDGVCAGLAPDVTDAVLMVASELAENVLKYAEPVDGVGGHVTVTRTSGEVEVCSVNRLSSGTSAVRVLEILERIADARDARKPFEERMMEIMKEPRQVSTGLGLLRVEYEGRFKLSARHVDGTLTLVAVRSLD